MVIAVALIFSMATAVYIENFRTPVYRASMTYAVTAKKGSVYSNANITVGEGSGGCRRRADRNRCDNG